MKFTKKLSETIESALGENSECSIYEAGWVQADGAVKYSGFEVLSDGMPSDEAEEAFIDACYESESNSRQFSPFEFTAHALNDCEDSERAWKLFDDGISDRIAKGWEEAQRKFTFSE